MVRVTTAAQAAAMDGRAIAAGTESWALMSAAGRAAADTIRARCADALRSGVLVFVGPGNNGGDGWLVAAHLADAGATVRVVSVGEPRSDDARRAKAAVPATVSVTTEATVFATADATTHTGAKSAAGSSTSGAPGVVIDALLGTGATGAPRDAIAAAIVEIERLRATGASVVALDVPSGVDATTGATPGAFVRAALTVTFGSVKRGLLRNRAASGAIVAVDIGLGAAANEPAAPQLVDAHWALGAVPAIPANANKGTRRRLLIVGGSNGMAGATILAARGALRSGIGMVKVCAEAASVAALQAAEPAALTCAWPAGDTELSDHLGWAHCVLLGPGLGLQPASIALAKRVLAAWRGPIVVDADALSAFEGRADELGAALSGRPAVITPHAVEAQRLAGVSAADIDAGRFEAAARLASRVHATVLLKGVPTVVSDGARTLVVPAGTPVLATGGSGDVLGGIVATLLAQTGKAVTSAAVGAWVHGRAAELAGAGAVRGVTLGEVLAAMRDAWIEPPPSQAPVLAELTAIGTPE